tara:strand:+ start:450 stop:1760 length:1311 start_codon:yes stop_codon:yes gene_type:complete
MLQYLEIRKFLLISLMTLIFFHFFKEEYSVYYLLLSIVYISSLLFVISDKEIYFYNSPTALFYFVLMLYFIWLAVWTLRFYNLDNNIIDFDLRQYLVGIGRMMLMPLIVLIFLKLLTKKEDYEKIILFFIFAYCIGTLTMLLQQFVGNIFFFGNFGPPRFAGLNVYPSSLGNITVFGSGVGMALICCFLNDKLNLFLKGIAVSLLILGVFLTMQKSALINLIIAVLILCLTINIRSLLGLFLILISLITLLFLVYPGIITNILSLVSNTLGLDIRFGDRSLLHLGIYDSIFNRFIDRQLDWLRPPSGVVELLFGWGIPGGSQAMGYSFTSSVDMQMDHRINPMISIGTTHNQYLDLYQMGGIFLPLTLMGLIICANIQLFINWIQFNDRLSKIFFFLNVIFTINLFVANGVLFQPIASIPFWLSISYLLRPNKPGE